jgi:hypothetical protein
MKEETEMINPGDASNDVARDMANNVTNIRPTTVPAAGLTQG